MTLITALPYDFGPATNPDQNFFRQLQANFDVAEAAFTGIIPQLAKAWASITVAAGVPTIQDSFNVASVVSDSGPGRFLLTLITSFSSVNWVPLALANNAAAGDLYSGIRAVTANTATIIFTDDAGTRVDPTVAFYFVGFGTQ